MFVVGHVLLEDKDYNYNPKFMIIHFSLNKIRLYLYQGQDQSNFNGFLSNHEHEIDFSEITEVRTHNVCEAAENFWHGQVQLIFKDRSPQSC